MQEFFTLNWYHTPRHKQKEMALSLNAYFWSKSILCQRLNYPPPLTDFNSDIHSALPTECARGLMLCLSVWN